MANQKFYSFIFGIEYKAVTGNELTHDWYEGYLSSDGVHPTALGAKAEAMRILCDIPEITQYN